jgi:hypothetical protein
VREREQNKGWQFWLEYKVMRETKRKGVLIVVYLNKFSNRSFEHPIGQTEGRVFTEEDSLSKLTNIS